MGNQDPTQFFRSCLVLCCIGAAFWIALIAGLIHWLAR